MVLAAMALAASAAIGTGLTDDFETAPVGELPPAPWVDISTRVEGHKELPTARVIETTGPDGQPTRAVQTFQRYGPSQGIAASIGEAEVHEVSADIRIDALPNAFGWPMAIGFSKDGENPDVNQDPHAVLYAWLNGQWRLFVSLGAGNQVADFAIPDAQFTIGQWQRVTLRYTVDTKLFELVIADPITGVEQTAGEVDLPWFDSNFDAIALYDGENAAAAGGTVGGLATIDNVEYSAEGKACPPDLDGDGVIGSGDLAVMLAGWGTTGTSADLDGDGVVGSSDLAMLLAAWGPCP